MLNGNRLGIPLTPLILLHLNHLQYLRLDDNKDISSFDVQSFNPISNIINLKLNTLQCLGRNATKLSKSLENLTQLEILELSFITLDRIPVEMFRSMKNLSILALSSNLISHWKPETFRSQRHLTQLFLAANRITNLDRKAFWYLPSLQFLDMSGNPFTCTCDLLSFRLWMDDSGIILQKMDTKSNYKCLTPPELRGTFLLDFTPTEENCMSYTVYFVLLSVVITYFTTVTCVTMLYRYWWYIRYVRCKST